MDNLTFEKIWEDDGLIQLRIKANCEFVSAYQDCYIQNTALGNIAEKIIEYVNERSNPPAMLGRIV